MKWYAVLILGIVLVSCHSEVKSNSNFLFQSTNSREIRNSETVGDTLKFDSKREYVFAIDNKESGIHSFGYQNSETSEDIGPRGITIFNGNIYIVDTWHRCLKKVSIETGKIIISQPINIKQKSLLGDITVFSNNLFLIRDDSVCQMFDSNLIEIKRLLISQKYQSEPKAIFWQTTDSLLLHLLAEDEEQLKNLQIPIHLVSINKNGNWINERKLIPANENFSYWKRDGKDYLKGKYFNYYKQDGRYFFRNDLGVLPVSDEIPSIQRYPVNNIDFDKSNLVYFNIDQGLFKLTIIKFH